MRARRPRSQYGMDPRLRGNDVLAYQPALWVIFGQMTDLDSISESRPVAQPDSPTDGPDRTDRWWRRAASGLDGLWWELAAYVLLIAAAATMRVWDLGSRALHHDESLHAYFTWRLAELAGYRHDPMMHGPLQFEAGSVVFLVLGDTDFTARLLYAVAGTVIVALPFLLRGRLGRTGALLTAGMLAFSPSMLYFSRFARNDILIAVWTLGLVISMWRYLDEGKDRYLYSSAALLALAFATKETAYIVTVVLGAYLAFVLLRDGWRGNGAILDGERSPSPPEAMGRLAGGLWNAMIRAVCRFNVSRPAAFLLLLVTLTMPQWSAAVSWFQDTPLLSWTGLVLAQSEGAHIGAPEGGGLVVAFLVVAVVLGVSVYWGYRWRWPVWWRCAVIFYGIWALLYTTFFTNITGLGSGVWRSLGYWIVQQGEARGDQPWYYYFLLTPLYEFLPLLFSLLAGLYYWRRRDAFGRFLVYWSVANFVLYTIASEKMPWLLVNITLPMIVLSGKLLNDLVLRIEWRRLIREGGLVLVPGVPLLLALAWWLALYERVEGVMGVLTPVALALALAVIGSTGAYMVRRLGLRNVLAFSALPLAALLMVLTVRAGAIAAYRHGDTPVEMLVYTQTSPDVIRVKEQIERVGRTGTDAEPTSISVDSTSGFNWPWAWYLRDYAGVSYETYAQEGESIPQIVLLHRKNRDELESADVDTFTEGERVRHRWWFPEDAYRGLTLGRVLRAFGDRDSWRTAMDYFLNRKGIRDRLGSEDAYVYYSLDLRGG